MNKLLLNIYLIIKKKLMVHSMPIDQVIILLGM